MRRVLLLLALVVAWASPATACELCDGPGSSFVSLQNHVSTWPLVALGEPVGRTKDGRIQFKVTRVLKGTKNLAPGAKVAPRGASAVLPGHVWLLLGAKANFKYGIVLMLRPGTLEFLRAAPRLPPADQPVRRLKALVPWLRHADPMVAASARQEFATAEYASVKQVAKDVSADDLMDTLEKPGSAASSRGTLFLLVGLSGGAAHRKRLAAWMRDPAVQRAPGYDALLAAWLLLTGHAGVAPIREVLGAAGGQRQLVGSAFVRALGFHARNDRVLSRAQVSGQLRALLAYPAFFDATVGQLLRLKAWDALEAVLAAYRTHATAEPWTAGPVLRYLAAHPSKEAAAERARLVAAGAKDEPRPEPAKTR